MLGVQRLHQRRRVANAIEKIRITKSNVLGTGGHLPTDVLQHHRALHNPKSSLIDRHNRTVPAQVLAAAACFYIAHRALPAIPQVQLRIARQRRQVAAVGYQEILPRQGNQRLRLAALSARLAVA